MIPYKCPVCEGHGIVPGGFYNSVGPICVSTSTTEICRACSGSGLVFCPEDNARQEVPYKGD